MESSAKHFFHMSKKNHRRKWGGAFNAELNNRRASPIRSPKMEYKGLITKSG